ncbi:unnamed protein product [Lota lota]
MAVTLVLLLVAVWAQGLPTAGLPTAGLPDGGQPTVGQPAVGQSAVGLPKISRPPCDSPDVEAAAMVAQDYLNAQHTNGYKYVLNRIEDVKIITTPSGEAIYLVELELLETTCHVLDPRPLANCSVRPKALTAIEGDCDVVLKEVGGALSVTAFKCKTEESREDMCLGCPTLLPLNDTSGLDLVHASLGIFNGRINDTFVLMEVGRMSKQTVSGGDIIAAEFVIIDADCTGSECVPLDNGVIFIGVHLMLFQSTNVSTAAPSPSLLPVTHATQGLRHHKLTRIHNPEHSRLLFSESTESTESDDVMPTVRPVLSVDLPAGDDSTKAVVVKREAESVEPVKLVPRELPLLLVPQCPGRIRHY